MKLKKLVSKITHNSDERLSRKNFDNYTSKTSRNIKHNRSTSLVDIVQTGADDEEDFSYDFEHMLPQIYRTNSISDLGIEMQNELGNKPRLVKVITTQKEAFYEIPGSTHSEAVRILEKPEINTEKLQEVMQPQSHRLQNTTYSNTYDIVRPKHRGLRDYGAIGTSVDSSQTIYATTPRRKAHRYSSPVASHIFKNENRMYGTSKHTDSNEIYNIPSSRICMQDSETYSIPASKSVKHDDGIYSIPTARTIPTDDGICSRSDSQGQGNLPLLNMSADSIKTTKDAYQQLTWIADTIEKCMVPILYVNHPQWRRKSKFLPDMLSKIREATDQVQIISKILLDLFVKNEKQIKASKYVSGKLFEQYKILIMDLESRTALIRNYYETLNSMKWDIDILMRNFDFEAESTDCLDMLIKECQEVHKILRKLNQFLLENHTEIFYCDSPITNDYTELGEIYSDIKIDQHIEDVEECEDTKNPISENGFCIKVKNDLKSLNESDRKTILCLQKQASAKIEEIENLSQIITDLTELYTSDNVIQFVRVCQEFSKDISLAEVNSKILYDAIDEIITLVLESLKKLVIATKNNERELQKTETKNAVIFCENVVQLLEYVNKLFPN